MRKEPLSEAELTAGIFGFSLGMLVALVCGLVFMPGCKPPRPTPTPVPTVEPRPTPTPVPEPPPCVLAGEPTLSVPDHQPTLGFEVNGAMAALRPDCSIGGTCLLGDTTQQEWQAAVEAKLRERALCAGQHTPTTDEIAVAEQPRPGVPGPVWEGYHVFAGDDHEGPVPPGGARRTVRWAPGAYTGAWRSPVGPGNP